MPAIDHLIEVDASQYPYTLEISKKLGKLDEVITWSKQELEHEWRWILDETGGGDGLWKYRFFFQSERDMCAFTMKWA